MLTLLPPSLKIFDTAASNVYRHDQDVVVHKVHGIGVFFERDWSARRGRRVSHYCRVVVSPSFIDVDGLLFSGGAFHWGVSKIEFTTLYWTRGVARVFISGSELSLRHNL